MTNSDAPVSRVFFETALACARKYGTPLPKRPMTLGDMSDSATGWGLVLNPTPEPIDDIGPFEIHVKWCGWPAGIVNAHGGVIAAGAAANEDALVKWLCSLHPEETQPQKGTPTSDS